MGGGNAAHILPRHEASTTAWRRAPIKWAKKLSYAGSAPGWVICLMSTRALSLAKLCVRLLVISQGAFVVQGGLPAESTT